MSEVTIASITSVVKNVSLTMPAASDTDANTIPGPPRAFIAIANVRAARRGSLASRAPK